MHRLNGKPFKMLATKCRAILKRPNHNIYHQYLHILCQMDRSWAINNIKLFCESFWIEHTFWMPPNVKTDDFSTPTKFYLCFFFSFILSFIHCLWFTFSHRILFGKSGDRSYEYALGSFAQRLSKCSCLESSSSPTPKKQQQQKTNAILMPLKFKIFRLLPHVVLMKTCNHYRSTFVIFIIMYCVIIFLLLSSFIIKFVIVVVLHAIFSWAYSLAVCTISRQYVLDARVMSQIIIRFQFCFCFIFVRTHTHGINFGFWWYKIRTMIPLACKWVCVCSVHVHKNLWDP